MENIRFFGIYPNPFSTDATISEFAKENGLSFGMWKDPEATFCKNQKLTVTPEVLVIRNEKVLYKGRIDDFYVGIGRHKMTTTKRFLETALQEIALGKTPEWPYVEPIGCVIDFRLWGK